VSGSDATNSSLFAESLANGEGAGEGDGEGVRVDGARGGAADDLEEGSTSSTSTSTSSSSVSSSSSGSNVISKSEAAYPPAGGSLGPLPPAGSQEALKESEYDVIVIVGSAMAPTQTVAEARRASKVQ
jgi:hypothetical protein